MWTLIITLLLSGDPLVVRIQADSLAECNDVGRQMEAQYFTFPARSFRCVRGGLE